MKKLNSTNYNNDLVEIEPGYPMEYKGIYPDDGYYGATSPDSEKTMLRNFFVSLFNHWFLVLTLTLLVTGATIVYVAQKPDYYKSQARVQVNTENNPAAGSRSGGSPIIVNNAGSDPAYFTTQLQILEGSGLLQKVIASLDLEHNENFLNPQKGRQLTVWQNVKKMFGLYHPPVSEQPSTISNSLDKNKININNETPPVTDKETERLASLVALLKKNLTVSPVKDSRTKNVETRLIEIEYTHEDPAIAAKIVNTISDLYVLQNLEQKVQTNASASDFLEKRIAELQGAIRTDEEKLINYSRNNQVISPDASQNTIAQRYSDLNTKLGQAENDRIAAQTTYQAALQNQMRAATDQSKDPQVVALESKLNELRQKLAQLKLEYTDAWYEVIQTKKQIEDVETQLATIQKRASGIQNASLEEKLNEAIAREKEIRSSFNNQRNEVIKQNEASINYKIIQQEIDTNKTLLDALLQRARENDVILAGTPNNVIVADRATVSRNPIGPERTKNVILAFFVSLFAGCGLAFLIEWLDDSVHHSDQIENELGLPLMAAIPAAPLSLGKRLLPKSLSLLRRNKPSRNYDNLDVFEKPAFLEAYLQLRTHLMLSTAGGPPKSILVTSGEESEGKTLTALNLAVSLSKNGENILLIDADLRCPRIHLIKELSNDYGLTSLLTAKEIDDQIIEKSIQKDPSSNLHILTAGERSVNPANLLCSEEMRTLLVKLSAKYVHIIIDSPPVLYFADSTILSAMVDSVVIVVRDGESSAQSVLKAKKVLQNVGAKVIGMVLNGIPWQRSNYSKYGYYEADTTLPSNGDYEVLKIN
ncbi:MAG: polysaccharide biosynthesis tyrosine autokinase [Actinomycetota bacterium]